MKLVMLALFVGLGTTAMCPSAMGQAAGPAPVNPDKLFQLPPQFSIQTPDFGKGLGSGNSLKAMPHVLVAPPKVRMNHAEIDRGIIVAPPPQFGGREKGTPVAQNLYPGLRLVPLRAGRLEPIPTPWPKLKIENIPTQWPEMKIVEIAKTAEAVKGPGK